MPANPTPKSARLPSRLPTRLRARSDSGSFPNADSKIRDDYIRRVARLGSKLKRRPTQRQLREVARIRDDHCSRIFGNYAALFRAAGYRSQVRGSAATQISADDILLDFQNAVARLGHFPTVSEYLERGGYSYNLIMKYFGAWWRVRLALENRSGHDDNWPRNPRDLPASSNLPAPPISSDSPRLSGTSMYPPHNDRPVCGTVLNYRAMLHQPTNEQGVVLLFGMMAEELGFIIENVRTGFPDCEGKRRVGAHSWQRVRIEFEYLSSRFNHPANGCDLVICWRHDNPKLKMEVISLEQKLRERSAAGAIAAATKNGSKKIATNDNAQKD